MVTLPNVIHSDIVLSVKATTTNRKARHGYYKDVHDRRER